jgi:GNAT superfamily N-acetyltransferase
MLTVAQVETGEQIRQGQELLKEYFEFLRTDVDKDIPDPNAVVPLAGYQQEIDNLPGKFGPPDGRFLLAEYEGEAAGCVAFYKFSPDSCEVKRLWTRPQFRGKKVGRALVERLIEDARALGYRTMILSTVDILKEAQSLYDSLGFEKTEPFFDGPPAMMAHEIFLKLDLTR